MTEQFSVNSVGFRTDDDPIDANSLLSVCIPNIKAYVARGKLALVPRDTIALQYVRTVSPAGRLLILQALECPSLPQLCCYTGTQDDVFVDILEYILYISRRQYISMVIYCILFIF